MMNRLRSKTAQAGAQALLHQLYEHIDTDAVRDRVTKAAAGTRSGAQTAARRGRSAAHDAPGQMRNSKAAETAVAAAAAALPIVTGAVADALSRRSVRRALSVTPMVARRSLLSRAFMGFGGVFAVAGAGFALHKAWKTWRVRTAMDDGEVVLTSSREGKQRMDDEGPLPGAYDGTPATMSRFTADGGSSRPRS